MKVPFSGRAPGLRAGFAFVAFTFAACGGADKPAVVAPKTSRAAPPRGFAQVTSMCAKITSCARPFDAPELRDPSACVDHLLLHGSEDPKTACLAKARTCKEVSQCEHGDADAVAGAFCAAHPGVLSACDGSRFVTCADPSEDSTVVDCAKLGGTCAENRLDGGLLVRGCVSPALCPAGAPETRCDGDRAVVACRDGLVDKLSCKPGNRCTAHHDPDGDTVATCAVVDEGHCAAEGSGECRDDKLVECVAEGHFSRTRTSDCKAHGLTCEARGSSAACVAASPSECVPFSARCDGKSLVYCAAGLVAKISCTDIGMGSCDPSAHGPEAACRGGP